MTCCILMGSPRKNGNTAALLAPFTQELEQNGVACETIWLYDKELSPCIACRSCQQDWSIFGCRLADDMQQIFDAVLACDLFVLATPIYSWYCTAPIKAVLDRLVYGMNKYYGTEKGPSLWAKKQAALLVTCGYRPDKGADLFEEGFRRYCKHSQLLYAGMHAERDMGYGTVFMDEGKQERTTAFARQLAAQFARKQ